MPTNFRVSSLIPTGLIVDSVMQDGDAIVVTAHAGAQMGPLCCSPSQRVHSRYGRQVSDLPCSGRGVCLRVVARRFFARPRIAGDRFSPNALTKPCSPSVHPDEEARMRGSSSWLGAGRQAGGKLRQAPDVACQ
jgi:hypothetical protein